ncbi:MAG: PLP-dependent transferase [Desulfobulbaceae bacterium]
MNGFSTRAIHGGLRADRYGGLRTPVYDTVAFEQATSRGLQLAFEGKSPAHVYTRISNPTVQDFELKIRGLTGAAGVVATSSGMAAISTTLLALAGTGTNIVTCRRLFGNTYSLLTRTLAAWGLEVRFIESADPDSVDTAIDPSTRAVYLETMTNPQLEVADFRKISAVTREKNVPLVVDNTLLTPYLFNTRDAGIDIELLSSTKYISGGATSMGGVIIDNGTFDWRRSPRLAGLARQAGPMAFIAALRREVFRNTGGCMSPHNAYLQSLGLETMALRIDRSCANAMALADFLAGQAKVVSVHYPGLPGSPSHEAAVRQLKGGFGSILTFDLADREACFAFADALEVIRRATNVNDNKTLIVHPASTIFAEYDEEEKHRMGVRPTMLRLSVGIEDREDLVADLERGLHAL